MKFLGQYGWPAWLAGILVVLSLGYAFLHTDRQGPESLAAPVSPADFVGTASCAACHQSEHDAWRGSHHDLAMQEAAEGTVLGDFSDASFTYAGTRSTFFRRDGRFMVRTDGPDGRLADFEIKYAFGVTPLQQYLIELPGGRLQALGIAWDSRPKGAGGQRWFHLYPDQQIRAGDPLHWTAIQQNWNYMCADCHSTNLRKHYDAASRSFETSWSDVDVGCEACHGPGSNHVAWARNPESTDAVPGKGLAVALDERKGVSWTIDAATGSAKRSEARATEREIEVCARCHSRRGQLTDTVHAGDPLHDGFRVNLLEAGLFHADGQQRDEIYNYAPFLQSRMYAKGVTCSDCHDAHTLKLRAQGNGVCLQCHAAQKFDAVSHHMHPQGSPGAACATCHMPTATYMVVDPRHDHGFRVPRPDLTLAFGTPNACNACHSGRSPQWASDAIAARGGRISKGYQNYADAFTLAAGGDPAAISALMRVFDDGEQPAIARATAVHLLARHAQPAVTDRLAAGLDDANALVRRAAVEGFSSHELAARLYYLPRMLGDRVRVVRITAASALADADESRLPEQSRASFRAALAEYEATLRYDADRPEAQANLGNHRARQGQAQAAIEAFRTAITLDPGFVPAYVNLADIQRAMGGEMGAEATLRAGLKADPDSDALHQALGLSLVRQGRRGEAMGALAKAVQLAPDNARNAYVYGVALHDGGRMTEAMAVLEAALARRPFDRDLLFLLTLYSAEQQRADDSRRYLQRLLEVAPDDVEARELAGWLGRSLAPPR